MKNKNISIKLDIQSDDFSKVSSLTKHFDKEIISLKKEIGENKLYNFSRDLYHKLFDRCLQKAEVLKQNGYKEESLKILNNLSKEVHKTLLFGSDDPALLFDLAVIHVRKSEFSDAQRLLEHIISKSPAFSISTYFLLSQIYKKFGQTQKTRTILKFAKDSLCLQNETSYSKKYTSFMKNLESVLHPKNDLCEPSIVIDDFFEDNIFHIFENIFDIERHSSFYMINDSDNSVFRNMVRIEAEICMETNTPLTFLLSYYNCKYSPELTLIAVDLLQEFSIPNSELIEIYWQAVKIYEQNGNISENISHTLKILELDPQQLYQRERLFELYLNNGEITNAIKQFEIIKLQSKSTTLIIREAAIDIFRKGNSALAIKICKIFLKLEPENPYIMKTLGDILYWRYKYSHKIINKPPPLNIGKLRNRLSEAEALKWYKQTLLDQDFSNSDEGKQLLITVQSIEN